MNVLDIMYMDRILSIIALVISLAVFVFVLWTGYHAGGLPSWAHNLIYKVEERIKKWKITRNKN